MRERDKFALGLGVPLFFIGGVNALVSGANLTQGVTHQLSSMAPFLTMMVAGFLMAAYGTHRYQSGS